MAVRGGREQWMSTTDQRALGERPQNEMLGSGAFKSSYQCLEICVYFQGYFYAQGRLGKALCTQLWPRLRISV